MGKFSKDKVPLIENLISEVQKYPSIWDITSKQYKDIYVKANVWNVILSNLKGMFDSQKLIANKMDTIEDLRKTWKSLKDTYFKSKKDSKPKSGSGHSDVPKPWQFQAQVNLFKKVIFPLFLL